MKKSINTKVIKYSDDNGTKDNNSEEKNNKKKKSSINNKKVILEEIDSANTNDKLNQIKPEDQVVSLKEVINKWKCIFFPILGVILLGVIIFVIIYFIRTPPKTPPLQPSPPPFDKYGPLEMQTEYKINTNKNDLKRIYINQRYYEDIKIDGILSKNIVDRKTNYDIYIISETESDEETKFFYNKTYLCAIAIASECVSSVDEFCLPKKLVDLIDQDYTHIKSLRRLDEVEDFKNFPLPLCFFNLTDNNVITSIACHKNISENRVNSIVLDLYFFRPPGIKRIDKEKGNITITTYKDGDKDIIKETNGGICDVENSIGSFCSTDMITKKDLKGNLLSYDEIAFTNITTNEDFYYIKNKTTTLIDKTEFLTNLDGQKYNDTLNILYPKLKDYLQYYVHFSTENFKELYNVSKGIPNENEANRLRLLNSKDNEKPVFLNSEKIFNFTHFSGFDISIKLQDNVGYNTEAMEASSYLVINDEIEPLEKIKEISDIDKAINKLLSLSRAGNNLATALYLNIKDKLNNITDIVRINIPSINNLILFKELTEVFDSTFSLQNIEIIPILVEEESNNLIKNLESLYNGIDTGSIKNNIRILNDYIYKFIKHSHELLNNLSDNLKDLGTLISSPKQAISQISTYYMNHTCSSYVNTIIEAKNILMNYYINEKDLIIPVVDDLLNKFENITIESIQKQINLVNKLNERLVSGNLTIRDSNGEVLNKDSNEELFRKITVNLENSNNYITNIINLFKQKVKNEMNLKNGYFISEFDIQENNKTFYKLIEDSFEIANNLENNEYIDKTFDKIMTNFRNEFISNMQYMEEIKEKNFLMEENTIKTEILKPSELQKISSELVKEGEGIINIILKENNKYLNTIREKLDNFLIINKPKLSEIMNELSELFSDVKLRLIDNSYETAFNGYLNKMTENIQQNKKLSNEYFDELVSLNENKYKIVDLLQNIPVDKTLPPVIGCLYPTYYHCWKYTKFVDSVSKIYKTQFYLNKYNIFKSKFENSRDFVNNDFQTHILQEYKKRINAIKEVLYTFKNNKMTDKYPELTDLYFINEDIKKFDEFYKNLNKYISEDKFNNYYLEKIHNYKTLKNTEINQIQDYIENHHNKIGPGGINNNYKDDFCTSYERKKTYISNNGGLYIYSDSGLECFESQYTNNYKNITLPIFISDGKFKSEFDAYLNNIKNKITSYNNLINSLKKLINDIESEILNEKITLNYLTPIEEKINKTLSEKFSDKLITSSYGYSKKILDFRLENTLKNIGNKWNNSFNKLEEKINDNIDNFKNSINEFGIIALIYRSIISQNLTKSYYDSIIKHQRTEFNYTIAYYYNCLLQNVTSIYQTIFNQIPTNQEGFNNILNLRKEEVNNKFNKLLTIINVSKNKSLSLNQQANILNVSPINFFNMDSVLNTFNNELTTTLSNKGTAIYKINGGKETTEYSLACRFYLENSLNGWHIEELYKPIDENIFVELKLENFKEILSNNWIFDQDDFINKLNLSIYNSNKEILDDFLEEKEKYKEKLEKPITDYYSKDSIIEKLDKQYNEQIKEINSDMANNIKQYIQNILNSIKNHLISEEKRIRENLVSYSKDFSTINNEINILKENILNKLKQILHEIVVNFTENIKNKVYKERVESNLNNYLVNAEKFSSTCETTYNTLQSSFNIGNITKEIINDLVIEYKNFTLVQIRLKNEEYIFKLEKWVKIEEIKNLIEDEIQQHYSILLKTLNNVSVDNIGNENYKLSNEIKDDINLTIDENMKNIKNILSQIKGDKYEEIDLLEWYIIDYDKRDVLDDINDKMFIPFINRKINEENNKTNTFLKDIIKKNFNILINNLIDLFGNEFFERIMNYNENFKISTLYQELKYSLVVSLTYYGSLYGIKKNIKSLTQDLKFKLYTLNNLDIIAEEKNQKVLNLLNKTIDLFIEESKKQLINDYKNYLKEDALIKLKFNKNIIESINNNLIDVSGDLEKDFLSILNEKFKKKL